MIDRRRLCVPATSVPNKLRSSLDPANMNMRVCLHDWMSNQLKCLQKCVTICDTVCVDSLLKKH